MGGGLSGLVVASGLAARADTGTQPAWALLEAHATHLGGRMMNYVPLQGDEDTHAAVDLGPAWVWPHHGQHHMQQLTSMLGLPLFEQPDQKGSGTFRIKGGAHALVAGLLGTIDDADQRVRRGWVLERCKFDEAAGEIILAGRRSAAEEAFEVRAKRVVLAVPPKMLAERVRFEPPLSAARQSAMDQSRTWMAGVTKVALLYVARFWPADATSVGLARRPNSPAFQVYDAGGTATSPAAITFFARVDDNEIDDAVLAQQCADQLAAAWTRAGVDTQTIQQLQTTRVGPSITHLISQYNIAPLFQNGANIRDLRCVLHPSTSESQVLGAKHVSNPALNFKKKIHLCTIWLQGTPCSTGPLKSSSAQTPAPRVSSRTRPSTPSSAARSTTVPSSSPARKRTNTALV